MWAFMEGWFTPSSLFIFLNLVIGTIVLTSRFSSHKKDPHHLDPSTSPPLARAPSLLDRVKSIDFSLYKFSGHAGGGYPEPDPVQDEHSSYPAHDLGRPVDSPPLARAPSLVDRLKSFDFFLYKFQEPSYAQPHDEHSSEREYADRDEPPRLARTPSLLERVKSIKFTSFYRSSEPDSDADALPHLGVDSDSDSEDDDSAPYADAGRARQDHQVRRIRSDSKTAAPGEAPARRLPAKMKKSASERSAFGHFEEEDDEIVERRRPKTAREGRKKSGATAGTSEEEGNEIDAKADAFINQFKQHLKLQRLDSIARFKEMLSRGAS